MNVLIAPDKFKGTLTAREAGNAIAEGWRATRPNDELEVLPMSDGGDGFGEIIGGSMGAEPVVVDTIDSACRPHKATFWFHVPSATAVIEAAQVNGLAILPLGKFHPFDLDTFGLGKVYLTAAEMGAKRILIGIGGSATNDGGFGFAKALGYQFLGPDGNPLAKWTDLGRLTRIVMTGQMPFIETIVACDVANPLLGPNGASRIYGPQKGLRAEDMPKAEACLARLAQAVDELNQRAAKQIGAALNQPAVATNFADAPGAGAAGGLGFGLLAFAAAHFRAGFDVFSEATHLEQRLKSADIVISGEGAMDIQSLMGKGVGSLAKLARESGKKFIGLAGSVESAAFEKFRNDPTITLMGIVPALTTLPEAKKNPAQWLRELASQAAKSV